MYTGKIGRLVHGRGFGFISARDGRDIFFHESSLLDVNFSSLKSGEAVEFEVEKTQKGPRAFNIKLVNEQ
jgi:CspA family cold shock protein